ncbi:MbtH family protein [Micromonospora sp. NPDC049282]|uniref:MbtH family protein n=1 Tax=Micromonospora sp. NPDC049282 TaxID=3364269 RepID=UPI0037217C80
MAQEQADERTYRVVVNDEEQYSIWLADRDLPLGWRAEGTTGDRAACLAHIERVWTDMRPLSLRRQMAGTGA